MSGLPTRFPRNSLINQSVNLQMRLTRLIEETNKKWLEASDREMHLVAVKLQERAEILEACRQHVQDATGSLAQLP